MSTFIEIRPTVHATVKTTAIRLDDDFEVTIRHEEQGKAPEHVQHNFANVKEGQQIDGTGPIKYVRVTKLDGDARCVIAVDTYHEADEADTVPPAGIYWYNTARQYAFGAAADPTKPDGEASDPAYPGGATQPFPTTIFNISTTLGTTAMPVGNTVTAATSYAAQRTYALLGTLAERRAHLKQMLRDIVDHPHFAIWMANADERAGNLDTSGPNIGGTLRNIVNLIARPQSFVVWLEMMANVINLDANLNSERKFNLLEGELGLGGYDVFTKAQSAAFGTAQITNGMSDRAQWRFHRFGSVATGTPWAYTKPTAAAWPENPDTTIVLTGANLGSTWLLVI